MSDYDEEVVIVRRENSARQVLAGFLVLALIIASCAVWGPMWIFHAAQWIIDHIVKPFGNWASEHINNAPKDVSPNAPGGSTPLP